MAIVTRQDRHNDLFALSLILIGIGLFIDGGRRLQEIHQWSYQHPGPRGVAQVVKFDEGFFEGTAGMVLVIAGAVAAGRAALAHRRRDRAIS